MLAKAMDYDELERYEKWISMGNKPTKFKWSSPDKAGTEPLPPKSSLMGEEYDKRIGSSSSEIFALGQGVSAIERIAVAQGREVVYIHPDGKTTNKAGNEIERTPDHLPYQLSG